MPSSRLRSLARQTLPPALLRAVRRAWGAGRGEWRYDPLGWGAGGSGWNSASVAEAQRQRWPSFLAELEGGRSLDAAHDGPMACISDAGVHNTLMCFGYVLGRASWMRSRVTMLDWGGGLGQYYQLARALSPDLGVEYTCRDLPQIVEAGREIQPALRFVSTDAEAFDRSYDLVMASSSLHYSEDWRAVGLRLARACRGYLYVTRQPVVERVASFVVRQRAYSTEYPGWFLNRHELLEFFASAGLRLQREVLIDEHPDVPNAPEQGRYRGFLFRAV